MPLQISCNRKWFTTGITLVIFLANMNWINVYLQVPRSRKFLSTWVTFMIFLTIMNWINVSLQVSCSRKWLFTWVTIMIFLTIMNQSIVRSLFPWSEIRSRSFGQNLILDQIRSHFEKMIWSDLKEIGIFPKNGIFLLQNNDLNIFRSFQIRSCLKMI